MTAMIPVAEARRFVLDRCTLLSPRPRAIGDALGLVLAETVRAIQPVPPFANSAMDGYAVRAADTAGAPVGLRVVATVMAGDDPTTIVVGNGDAARIMTGAPMPPGADSVCVIERTQTKCGGSVVVVEEAVDQDENVRRVGEDIAAGAEVFVPGTLLSPSHLGVLASLGIETVLVRPAPRVAVVSTGDELATASGALAPGKIHDANRPALLAQLRSDGFEAVDLGMVGDDETALAHVLESGGSSCDAVVASGGVSVGDRDVAKTVLKELCGQAMRWMQVAIKPAKPFAFGTLTSTGTPVFGLPGNPVSALVSYELFVRPALRAMAGYRVLDRPRLTATTETDLGRRPDGKLHLLRVLAHTGADGLLRVRPSGGQDSHMLRAMAEANALALLRDGYGVAAGGRVDVLLLDAERLRPRGQEQAW
jgi:molybdopterin molybdotransferase